MERNSPSTWCHFATDKRYLGGKSHVKIPANGHIGVVAGEE
jgi:hypothetical protein